VEKGGEEGFSQKKKASEIAYLLRSLRKPKKTKKKKKKKTAKKKCLPPAEIIASK